MVQMQAMASGLAIICTENSGGRELVDENYNGFIVDIRNVDVLKQKFYISIIIEINYIKWV